MANLRYIKDRRKWRVRWHAKARISSFVFSGSQYFSEKPQAIKFYGDIEEQEKLVRCGSVTLCETIEEAVTKYFQHSKRFTSRTQGHYKNVLTKFVAALPKSFVRIHQLDHKCIEEYLYRMKDRNCTNRTQNAHLTPIKSFCRYVSRFYNIENPALKVKMLPEDPPYQRFLTEEEYNKLLKIAPPLARNRLIFLANTGLRASEFAGLARIEPSAASVTIIGKGRKRRTVPLNHNTRQILPDLVICSKNALDMQFKRLARRAKIPLFGPHACRHYFATKLLLKGVSMVIVSKLLGHSSVRTTEQCYAHILPEHIANATDVLDD